MAKWKGVVTNAGANLLRGWAAGEKLTITRVEAGSGTVEEVAMMGQTDVAGGGKEASLVGSRKLDKAVQFHIQIMAQEQGYTLHQLGVWAALNGGTDALLALFQNLEGVPISSRADTPDFLYTFYGVVALNNSGTIEVLTDGNAWVTLETLNEIMGAAREELSDKIEDYQKEAIRIAGAAADKKIATHNEAEDAHSKQIAAAVQEAVGRLKLEIMTNALTLPLAADGGEALLASGGTPLLAVYHPNQNASALTAVEALAGELSGRIAAAKAEAAGEAVTAADVKIRAAVAAHNRAEAAHPTHLSVIKKS